MSVHSSLSHSGSSSQVKDSDRVQLLGSLSIPLSRLLANHDLSVDDWFPLADAKPTSRISLRAVLRVRPLPRYALVQG